MVPRYRRPFGPRQFRPPSLPSYRLVRDPVENSAVFRRVGFAFRPALPGAANPPVTFPHVSLTSKGTPIAERQLMFRKSILWLHRWTGLAITAFIIVMAVTGTIL